MKTETIITLVGLAAIIAAGATIIYLITITKF
jgi:hypothetical protein